MALVSSCYYSLAMTGRRLSAVVILLVVGWLVPLAYASPPDQAWICGFYDNADFDDVVLFITSNLGVTQPSMGWELRPVASVVGFVTPVDTGPRPLCPWSSARGRAPPLA